MPKVAIKATSPSSGLTLEEFRELVKKLRDISDALAREFG